LDLHIRDSKGRTPLIIACSHGQLDIVCELLKCNEVDVDASDYKGRTAFYWAGAEDRWEVVLELLKHGEVDVNVQGAHGNTVVIWACLRGRLDVVTELLKDDRVNVSVRNKAGSTALDIARKCKLFEIESCIEEHSKLCLRREWNVLRQGVELNGRERKRRRLSK
jgi:ankyrin repeat protein